MQFSAALLAGGRSTRMGRDKAALHIGGEPLWQKQIGSLRATGPVELFISGPADGPYAGAGIEIIPDSHADAGPLAGIAAVLTRIRTDFLLVLAVDMPEMTPEYLRTLTAAGAGVVPIDAAGRLEPLAAIYPRAALGIAEAHLRDGHRKLEHFIRAAESAGTLHIAPIAAGDAALFANWNTPADLPR